MGAHARSELLLAMSLPCCSDALANVAASITSTHSVTINTHSSTDGATGVQSTFWQDSGQRIVARERWSGYLGEAEASHRSVCS